MKFIIEARIRIIRWLIEVNEHLFVTRRLYRFYQKKLHSSLNNVIDVGANTGQSIEIFLKINPKCNIYSFEPNPRLFKKLVEKYKSKKNVHLYDLGISSKEGTSTFHENILHSTSSLEQHDKTSDYLKKKASILGVKAENLVRDTYPITVTTLSRFIEENSLGTIDILKLDTEGHEYSCLKGLFESNLVHPVKYIQIEVHGDDLYGAKEKKNDPQLYLEQNSFKLEKSIRHGFGDMKECIYKGDFDSQ